MITQTASSYDMVTRLLADIVVTFHHVSWEEYDELLEQVGQASGLGLSFDDGTLRVMSRARRPAGAAPAEPPTSPVSSMEIAAGATIPSPRPGLG